MIFREWAAAWGVPMAAVEDLERRVGLFGTELNSEMLAATEGKSESWAQSAVRLEAAQKGLQLFRNNVGALRDERGVPVRYGLGNDSPAVNQKIKSADLIGIRPRLITSADVGRTIGQFVSREMKAPGWHYTGTGREVAQLAWANLINAKGGDAAFATGPGSL